MSKKGRHQREQKHVHVNDYAKFSHAEETYARLRKSLGEDPGNQRNTARESRTSSNLSERLYSPKQKPYA